MQTEEQKWGKARNKASHFTHWCQAINHPPQQGILCEWCNFWQQNIGAYHHVTPFSVSQVLTIEYDVVVKEQEEARKKAEEEEKRMREMVWAVKIIQKVWRSYYERRRQEKQKGKKGKGKGKGKGKAGKGKGKKKKT